MLRSATETLDAEDKFFCDACGGLQEAQKWMKIKALPRVLCLHLKRFKYIEQLDRRAPPWPQTAVQICGRDNLINPFLKAQSFCWWYDLSADHNGIPRCSSLGSCSLLCPSSQSMRGDGAVHNML